MRGRDLRGRARRADADILRRPSDGFRTARVRRFEDLAAKAVARLPPGLAPVVAGAEIRVVAVPDDLLLAGAAEDMPLAVVDLRRGAAPVITVHRRAIELRATARDELEDLLAFSVRQAVREVLGLGPEPEGR